MHARKLLSMTPQMANTKTTPLQETVELSSTSYPYLLRITSYLVATMFKSSKNMHNACL